MRLCISVRPAFENLKNFQGKDIWQQKFLPPLLTQLFACTNTHWWSLLAYTQTTEMDLRLGPLEHLARGQRKPYSQSWRHSSNCCWSNLRPGTPPLSNYPWRSGSNWGETEYPTRNHCWIAQYVGQFETWHQGRSTWHLVLQNWTCPKSGRYILWLQCSNMSMIRSTSVQLHQQAKTKAPAKKAPSADPFSYLDLRVGRIVKCWYIHRCCYFCHRVRHTVLPLFVLFNPTGLTKSQTNCFVKTLTSGEKLPSR